MPFDGVGQKVVYQCTALKGTNKGGHLKSDERGYYTVTLGALNSFNSVGAYYPLQGARQLFDQSSDFIRRIESGNCKGECGHPKKEMGQSMRDYLIRIRTIEETNVCFHLRRCYLLEEGMKDHKNQNVVGIIGEVKPSGPHGNALKEALENPDENVCFSIRSLTLDQMQPNGILYKTLKSIITFDWVTEPGISVATKWTSPSLESRVEMIIDDHHLSGQEETHEGISMESIVLTKESLRKELGWDKPIHVNTPLSANW